MVGVKIPRAGVLVKYDRQNVLVSTAVHLLYLECGLRSFLSFFLASKR